MVKEDKVQVTLLVDSRKAVNELGKLELEAAEAKQAMKGLKKGSEEFVAASARLKEATANVEALRNKLGLAGMSMNQLKNYQAQLNREIGREVKGSERWTELKGRIQQVSKALSDQRSELAGTNTLWHRISAEARQFGMMALAYLGAQELLAQITNLVGGLAKLSDAMADVQKTTGLTAEEVESLGRELKKLDTRTSRKDLLELASIAGKLGVSGRKDVLEFVKAADKINVALGSDFGGNAEEAIKQVGKLAEIFKLREQFGLEASLLKVGSAINSLGAASSAAEGYLVDFAKRMGGIAPSAKISAADILALGATMDQLGQASEVSSTALAQLLVAMAQDMPAFAKLAGRSVQEFSSILAEDANEALIMVLEGAKSTEGGLAGMSATLQKLGIDGARSAAVVGVLSENTKLLREQQALARREFEAGTSILKEYEVKNTNLAASLEKLQKRIAGIFINSGLMEGLHSMLSWLERATRASEDFSNGLRAQEAQLRRTSSEMNAAMEVLKAGNIPTEQRRDLIAQINEKYREYLPFLLTEKSGIEEVARVQQEANKAMMQKILMAQQDAEMAERKNKMGALEVEIERRSRLQLQKRIEMKEAAAKKQWNTLGFLEAEYDELQRGIDARRQEVEQIQKSISSEQELYDAVMKRLSLAEQATETPQQRLDRLRKEYELEKLKLSEMSKQASLASATAVGDEEREAARLAWENVAAQKNVLFLRNKAIEALQKEIELAKAKNTEIKGGGGGGGDSSITSQTEIDRTIEKWKELQAKVLKAKDEAWASGQVDFQAELAEVDRKYEALLNEARTFHGNMKVGDEEYNAEVQKIISMHANEVQAKAKELNEGLVAENKAKNEKILQDDLEFWGAEADARRAAMEQEAADRQKRIQDTADMYSAMGGLLSEFSSLLSATNSLIAQQGESQSEFQRQLALVNIAIDTAVSISKAIAGAATAAAATGPAAPFTFAAYMVSMVGAVVNGFAKAKAFLDSDTPQAPTFYHGGPTGDGPAIGYDQYGKIVGGVHKDEYVVSSRLLGIPWVANQVAIMEAIRVGRAPEPQSMPQPMPGAGGGGSAGGGESALAAALLSRLDRLEAAVLSLDKPSRAYFSRDEAEAMNRYFDKENENRLNSRL